ncbi:CPBP family intramembrane glutamic endopeptidase [Thermogemmatispora sp.]|uniref:CPBP family intramembrane glutamic endopeptidase n=1 Tax=Thermogemmatispora sp. TaxID=1968838 RepID=UPI0035E43E91
MVEDTARGASPLGSAAITGPHGGSFVQRHPLLCYYVLAFGFSWTAWIPLYLSQEGLKVLPYHTFYQLSGVGTFIGPALAAILVTALSSGRQGLVELFSRVFKWRVGLQWYLLSLLGIPLLLLVAAPIGLLLVRQQPVTPADMATLFNWGGLPGASGPWLLHALIVFVFGGPLGEEIGWRGFALPRLEQVRGPFLGSLIVAVLWFVWHVPLIVLYPAYIHYTAPLPYLVDFFFDVLVFNVYITTFYNRTGSALITMFCHTSVNMAGSTIKVLLSPNLSPNVQESIMTVFNILFLGIAVLIMLVTLGRQGYQPGRWGVLPQPGSQERYIRRQDS